MAPILIREKAAFLSQKERMQARLLPICALGLALLAGPAGYGAAQPASASAPAAMAGTWDLTWQTRHGPERNGWLVVTQSGSRIAAEIHGKGAVKAKGTIAGHDYVLRGSRMMVPYTISGRVDGDRLTGTLKILSVQRSFTGARR